MEVSEEITVIIGKRNITVTQNEYTEMNIILKALDQSFKEIDELKDIVSKQNRTINQLRNTRK